MAADILVCLQALLDPNASVRGQAEERLKQFQSQPGYATELCRIVLSNTHNIAHRQSAAVVLKLLVKAKWEQNETNEVAIDEAEKANLRALLIPGLGDPISLIRTSIAVVIARIAKFDWPDQWMNLMPTLIQMLHSPDANIVHGSISTLAMLVNEDSVSDRHLPLIVHHLFPEILAIFQSNSYPETIRVKAAQIFETTVNFMLMVQTEECDKLLKTAASPWIETFIQAITQTPPSLSRRDYGIPCIAIQTLTAILKSNANILKNYLTALLPPIWNAFTVGLEVYERTSVKGDEGAVGGPVGEDGMGVDEMAKAVIEFMQDLSEKKSIKKMMEPHIENIAFYSIDMQLTAEQALLYETDPNQYVADEEDDTFSYNPRTLAVMVLQNIADNYKLKGMKAIYSAIEKRLAQSAKYAIEPQAWALREAVLLAIGSVADNFNEYESKAPAAFHTASLYVNLFLPLLSEQIPATANHELAMGLWYIKGRVLWCASQFSENVNKTAALPFFHTCCAALQPAEGVVVPIPVKMAAVKAVARFCYSLPASDLRGYVSPVMTSLLGLIPSASDDSLVLLLQALLALSKLAPDITADNTATLGPYVQHVWAHHAADPQLTEDAKEILLEIFKFPKGFVAIYPTLSVTLHNVLYNPTKLVDMVDASLDLVRMAASTLFDPADPNTTQAQTLLLNLIQDLMPAIFNLLLTTPDESLLRTGAECAASLLRFTQCVLPTHLPSATKLAYLLLDHKSESVQRHAGTVVTQLIMNYSSQLSATLPELLLKVVGRLEHSKLPMLKQDLLMVFIRLINTQYETRLLLDFLSGITVGGTNGLPFFMAFWTHWHENFTGALNVKASLVALGKVFKTQDARLDAIQVPGELIVNVNAPRQTRSKKAPTETWSQVPLRLKIVYIFAKDYQTLKVKSESYEDEDEDDDGEEVEDGDDDEKGQELSDLMDEIEDAERDDDDDEPLSKLDPLHAIPTGKIIEEWIKAAMLDSQQVFTSVAQQLPQDLQQVLHGILQPQPANK